jgi:N,N'-diacetylbacillosaminyl-diphospho-undecaprenol alpha-1,3-N-acetylgalactosaminyltransferase
MKIALVCTDDLSVVLFCKKILIQLKSKDNDIIVLSDQFHNDSNYINTIKSWGCQHRKVKMYRFLNPLKDLKYIFSLNKIMKEENFDLVFTVTTKPNIYGVIVANWNNVEKIICGVWGFGITAIKRKTIKDKMIYLIFKFLYSYSFKKSDKIWFTNPNYAESGFIDKEKNKEKIILTKNYVDTDEYSINAVNDNELSKLKNELGFKKDDQSVVMVSRMSWSKGVKEFIDAADIVNKLIPNIHFILVGPMDIGSPDAIEEEYIIKKVSQIDKLQWLGFRNDTINLYAISSLAVYPTYYPEGGYPRGITEPMSLGKPVIATDNENCKNTIDHNINGILVPEKDSSALADMIIKLLNSKTELDRLSINARKKVLKDFDEQKIINKLLEKIINTKNNTINE